jgi:hypothetical protein
VVRGVEKGRQLGFLTAGTYRINAALFRVVTPANSEANALDPARLQVSSVQSDMVGIVTTLRLRASGLLEGMLGVLMKEKVERVVPNAL